MCARTFVPYRDFYFYLIVYSFHILSFILLLRQLFFNV